MNPTAESASLLNKVAAKLTGAIRERGMAAGSWYLVCELARRLTATACVRRMRLVDYQPVPKLVVHRTDVRTPRFPVVDAHNHLGEEFGGGWIRRPVPELLDVMDQVGVEMLVDLDGAWGEHILEQHLSHFKEAAPYRFQVFAGVDWSRWNEQGDGFGDWAATRLEAQVGRGAQGLKIWKALGLSVRDQRGALVPVNDRRLDPLWDTAARLRLPVVIHVADPAAFFDRMDRFNERYQELARYPQWSTWGLKVPAFHTLLEQFADLVLRHPGTTYIGAHVGCYAENLEWVSNLMEQAPNFYVDISARLAELGRQPHTARRFFLQHADRVLFGADICPQIEVYRLYYRFLQTDDDYFDHSIRGVAGQGRWKIYGVSLPGEVLRKVYQENARRVLLPCD